MAVPCAHRKIKQGEHPKKYAHSLYLNTLKLIDGSHNIDDKQIKLRYLSFAIHDTITAIANDPDNMIYPRHLSQLMQKLRIVKNM